MTGLGDEGVTLRRGVGRTARPAGGVDPAGVPARSSAPDGAHEAHAGSELSATRRQAVRGTSARRLAPLLSDRDIAVLSSLAMLRLAGAGHLERLHFREGSVVTQSRRCRRVLQRLTNHHLIARLERRIGGVRAGSAGFIYRIAPKGLQVLDLLSDGPDGSYRRRPEPSRHLADHTLAGTELYVGLVEAQRAGQLELLRYEPEPTCWRSYLGHGGQRVVLRPDALVVTAAPGGDTEHWWFIEVDLGTEAPTTIRTKVDAYQAYAATGQEQAAQGVFPRVAFLTTTDRRAAVLDRAVRSVPGAETLCAVGLLAEALAVIGPERQSTTQHLKGGES